MFVSKTSSVSIKCFHHVTIQSHTHTSIHCSELAVSQGLDKSSELESNSVSNSKKKRMSKKKSSDSVGENGGGDVSMVGDGDDDGGSAGGKKVQEEEQLVLWR